MKSKKYSYDWEELEGGKSPLDLAKEIIADEDLEGLEEIIIGQYTPGYDTSPQEMIDYLTSNSDKLQHIKSLFVGDMSQEECEVSWIEQGNYEDLLMSLPNLEKLVLKGSQDLELGNLNNSNLKELRIISGGTNKGVFESIANGNLPKLKSLFVYVGIEEYGFDGDLNTIKPLFSKSNFPNLEVLGVVDSEIQDEIIEIAMKSDILPQLKELYLGYGTMTDIGGSLILKNKDKLSHLNLLDLEYHFLSDEMMEKLYNAFDNINLDDQEEADEWDGEFYYYPMLTE